MKIPLTYKVLGEGVFVFSDIEKWTKVGASQTGFTYARMHPGLTV